MKKQALILLAGLAITPCVNAAPGDVLGHFRILSVQPKLSTSGQIAGANPTAQNAITPELGITSMLDDHFSAEFTISMPHLSFNSNKFGNLGKVNLLPINATLQYRFNPQGTINPYIGGGINYTRFYDNGLKYGSIKNNSWGPVGQLGVNIAITKDVFLNADVKKISMKTSSNTMGTLKLDPWIYGLGVGMKF